MKTKQMHILAAATIFAAIASVAFAGIKRRRNPRLKDCNVFTSHSILIDIVLHAFEKHFSHVHLTLVFLSSWLLIVFRQSQSLRAHREFQTVGNCTMPYLSKTHKTSGVRHGFLSIVESSTSAVSFASST